MSDTPGSRSGNRTPLDEGDVESMPVSLTTSPRKLVQVGIEHSRVFAG